MYVVHFFLSFPPCPTSIDKTASELNGLGSSSVWAPFGSGSCHWPGKEATSQKISSDSSNRTTLSK